MPHAAVLAGAPIAGALVGKAIGGGGAQNAQSATPKDLQPLRQQNIGLLQYLLGFNQPGMPWSGQQQSPQQQPGGMTGAGVPGFPTGAPGPNTMGLVGTPWAGSQPAGYLRPASQGGPIQRGQPALEQMSQQHGSLGIPGQPQFSMQGGGGVGGALGGAGPVGGALSGLGGIFGGGGTAMHDIARQMIPGYGGGGPQIAQEGPGMMQGGMGQYMPQRAHPGFNDSMMPDGLGSTGLLQSKGLLPSTGNEQMLANQGGGQGGFPNPLGRIESYFGPLGTPTSPLQQQSMGGISQFLSSNPYSQSNSALNGILGGGNYGEANQAFRNAGSANVFGGAQNAFNQLGNQNFFGGAQSGFNDVKNANYTGASDQAYRQLLGGNYFGGAQDVFSGLANYNPFGAAQHSLEGQLGTNPGQGVMEALRPQFDRNLAAANQQGGRFGSANALRDATALQDYNLLSAQALQQGVSQQQNAASILGAIGNSLIGAKQGAGQGLLGVGQGQMNQQATGAGGLLAGGQTRMQQGLGAAQGLLGVGQGRAQNAQAAANGLLGVGQGQLNQLLGSAQGLGGLAQALSGNQIAASGQLANNQNSMFQNLVGGYGVGQQQAGQDAQRQQQALSILQNLLGTSFGATFGQPTVVQPTGAQQGAQMGGDIASILAGLARNQG